MPIITADTSQATDFEASQPGTYLAKIVNEIPAQGKPKEGNPKGTPGLKVELEFTAPRLADNEVRVVTRTAWLPTAGKGTFGLDQLLRCTGNKDTADRIKAAAGSPISWDTDIIHGKTVNVIISNQPYNNKLSDQVESFLPA